MPLRVFLLVVLFSAIRSQADAYFLPRTKADLDIFTVDTASKLDRMVFVEGSRVAYFNRSALQRDFTFLKDRTDLEIESWILKNCAYISEKQLRLDGIRQSPIPVSKEKTIIGFRPERWDRAAVVPVADFDGNPAGLIDLKGAGLRSFYDRDLVAEQASEFEGLRSRKDTKGIDELRSRDHSDGLATLGEGIAEVVRGEALQKSFDEYNKENQTNYESVEIYFIISFPFKILREQEKVDAAALIGRQAHFGRSEFGKFIPNEIYIDPHGGKQTDALGSAVDMGGVFPVMPEFREKFLTDVQIRALADKSLLENKELYKKVFNPQESNEWRYAHDTAKAFLKEEGEARVIYNHLDTMVGKRVIAKLRRIESAVARLKTLLSDRRAEFRQIVASRAINYRGEGHPDVFKLLFADQDPEVRKRAAAGFYGDSPPAILFEIGIASPYADVREKAARQLGSYRGEHQDALFLGALADISVDVRKGAVSALREIRWSDERVPLFQKALGDKSADVRKHAVLAFEAIRWSDKHKYEVFNQILNDPDPGIRYAAYLEFKQIDWKDEERKRIFIKLISDSEPDVRTTTARSLSKYEKPDAHVLFKTALSAKNEDVRRSARFALSTRDKDIKIFNVLLQLLDEPEEIIRKEIAELVANKYCRRRHSGFSCDTPWANVQLPPSFADYLELDKGEHRIHDVLKKDYEDLLQNTGKAEN